MLEQLISYYNLILQNPYAQNQWVHALLIIILTLIFSKIIVFISRKVVHKIIAKTKTTLDDLLIKKCQRPAVLLLIVVGFKIAVLPLKIPEKAYLAIQDSFNSIIIVILTYVLIVIADVFIDYYGKKWARKTKSSLDDDLLPLFHKFSKVLLVIFGVLAVLSAWQINVTGFLAGLGIAGIAIGFAVKDSLANIFGGISLILDQSIRVGDKVKLKSGDTGIIKEVGLRSTRIQTYDNELLIVPNGQLAIETIQNYVQPDVRARVTVSFGVEYGAKHEKVKEIVLGVIEKLDKGVLKEPAPVVMFLEMGDFALKFNALFWIEDYQRTFELKEKATCAIYDALNKAKIGIPFPTSTIYVKK